MSMRLKLNLMDALARLFQTDLTPERIKDVPLGTAVMFHGRVAIVSQPTGFKVAPPNNMLTKWTCFVTFVDSGLIQQVSEDSMVQPVQIVGLL